MLTRIGFSPKAPDVNVRAERVRPFGLKLSPRRGLCSLSPTIHRRVAVALALLLLAWAVPVLADEPLPESDEELARRYAPVLYFHPAEVFRPQPVEVIVERARLRQSHRL